MRFHLKDLEEDILKCSRCGFCRASCPVFEVKLNESWNARGRILLIRNLMEEKIGISEEFINRIYSCTLCKACEVTCPTGVKTEDILLRTRKLMAKENLLPEQFREMTKVIMETGNIYGKRMGLPEQLKFKNKEDRGNLVFIGCVAAYGYPEHAENFLQILKRVKYKFYTLEEERCCGGIMKSIGLEEEFSRWVKRNLGRIETCKPKKIISICPMCSHTLKEYVNKATYPFEVVHEVEVLRDLIESKKIKLKKKLDLKVSYFDPCHLGRYLQVFETPRRILSLIPGIEVIELGRNKQFSRCCGGPIRSIFPEIRDKLSDSIFQDAEEKGVDLLVTSCPTCYHNLYASSVSFDLEVIDLAELVAMSMGIKEKT